MTGARTPSRRQLVPGTTTPPNAMHPDVWRDVRRNNPRAALPGRTRHTCSTPSACPPASGACSWPPSARGRKAGTRLQTARRRKVQQQPALGLAPLRHRWLDDADHVALGVLHPRVATDVGDVENFSNEPASRLLH